MEKLKIKNFGGIKDMEFEFKPITVLIGPQGSGKSIVAKLFYFFKSFVANMERAVFEGLTKQSMDSSQKEIFTKFFPRESWPKNGFKIEYIKENSYAYIAWEGIGKLEFKYSDDYKKLFVTAKKLSQFTKTKFQGDIADHSYVTRDRERKNFNQVANEQLGFTSSYRQIFVPAGRSFFANIQNSIFSFLSDNRTFDPFLIEFGSYYETFKSVESSLFNDPKYEEIEDLFSQIINGKYLRDKDKDYFVHKDGRKVNLVNASSGQQEILPLMIILRTLNLYNFYGSGTTLYIEEPEAHLFPTAQKRIIQLLARTFNHPRYNFQIVVTTHSPYVLSSFNNLMEAGKILKEKPDLKEKLSNVTSIKEALNPEWLSAYSIFNNKNTNLIDKETQLISQTILDSVSNEIAIEFDKLLDLEF